MAQPFDEEEEPLDPALLRVQQRLRRLMLIGGVTLGLGIGAVLIAIIYRFFIADTPITVSTPNEVVIGEIAASEAGLSTDAFLVSVTLDRGIMAMAFRDGDDIVTVFVDIGRLEVIGRFRVTGE